MKLKSEIDCKCAVKATLSDDGESFFAQFVATAVYDEASGATVVAKLDLDDDDQAVIQEAMILAMQNCSPKIHNKMMDAIATARKVAKDKGEIA